MLTQQSYSRSPFLLDTCFAISECRSSLKRILCSELALCSRLVRCWGRLGTSLGYATVDCKSLLVPRLYRKPCLLPFDGLDTGLNNLSFGRLFLDSVMSLMASSRSVSFCPYYSVSDSSDDDADELWGLRANISTGLYLSLTLLNLSRLSSISKRGSRFFIYF